VFPFGFPPLDSAILWSMRASHIACHTLRVSKRSRSGGGSSNTFL
jgi:hypothetical protein